MEASGQATPSTHDDTTMLKSRENVESTVGAKVYIFITFKWPSAISQFQHSSDLPSLARHKEPPTTDTEPPTIDKKSLQASSAASTSSRSVIETTSLAASGKTQFYWESISSLNSYQSSWILDSGAIDHMTLISNKFVSYEPSTTGKNVQIANGTLLTVARIGKYI